MFFSFYLLQQKDLVYFSFPHVWVKSHIYIVYVTLVIFFFRGQYFFPFFQEWEINKSKLITRYFCSGYIFMYVQYSCNLCSGLKATCILHLISELCSLWQTSIKHQPVSPIHNTIPIWKIYKLLGRKEGSSNHFLKYF